MGLVRRALMAVALFGACAPPPPVPDDARTDAASDALACAVDAAQFPDDASACPLLGRDESACMDLTLGTSREGSLEGFRPIDSESVLWVTPGPQGLQHIVLAFRTTGADPRLPLMDARLFRADDCEPLGTIRFRLPLSLDPADTSRYGLAGTPLPLVDDADPYEYCTVLGRDALLALDFSDGQGRSAHREVRVHIGGINPETREELREAWLQPCHADAGVDDAGR